MSVNLVISSGVLARHGLRYTPKGTAFLEASLVGKRPVGENHLFFRTDWVFYGKQTETWAEALVEGRAYQAIGRLEYDAWEVEGVKASRIRIIGSELYSLEGGEIRQEEKGPILYGAENRVILSGGLTADAQVRQTVNKTPVAKASLGFSTWDKEGSAHKDHYIELEAWREAAAQFAGLEKGTPVLLEGALKLEVWEDKETQLKRYKRLVEVHRLLALSRIKPVFDELEFPQEPLFDAQPKPKSKKAA